MSGSTTQQPVSLVQNVNANPQTRAIQQLPQTNLTAENIWLRSGNYKAGSLMDPNVPVSVGSVYEFCTQIGLSIQGFIQDMTGGYKPAATDAV